MLVEINLSTHITKNFTFEELANNQAIEDIKAIYNDDIRLFAEMLPAREVGGDFYTFVQIDDTHLGLVMADVSGKGIPAALFMMASNILLSEKLRLFTKPSEALAFLNNRICIHNKTNMFVTIWAGIIDLTTGHVIACNAGHDDPVICSKKKGFEIAKSKHNLAVGALEDATYTDYEFDLNKGDKLFLYTDGVVEAMNKNDIDDIKAKKEALQETAMAFATKVYEEAAKESQANQNNEAKEDKKDDVIDAEFEEK